MLFDLDGTLIDSAPLHEAAFTAVLAARLPARLPGFDYERVRGQTTRQVFEGLGVADPELLAACVEQKQAHYRDAVASGRLRPMPGARDLILWLRGRAAGVYLVTGGSRRSIEAALGATDLAGLFDGIVTAEDAPRGKPAPDGYLHCLARYNLAAADCCAVEDAPDGIAACRAANIRVAGVFNPAVQETADLWLRDLLALRDELDRRLAEATTA
jgi:HAD superfamily hydrolase (TIGR01509 family)